MGHSQILVMNRIEQNISIGRDLQHSSSPSAITFMLTRILAGHLQSASKTQFVALRFFSLTQNGLLC